MVNYEEGKGRKSNTENSFGKKMNGRVNVLVKRLLFYMGNTMP